MLGNMNVPETVHCAARQLRACWLMADFLESDVAREEEFLGEVSRSLQAFLDSYSNALTALKHRTVERSGDAGAARRKRLHRVFAEAVRPF
jgi:hypothetical protein